MLKFKNIKYPLLDNQQSKDIIIVMEINHSGKLCKCIDEYFDYTADYVTNYEYNILNNIVTNNTLANDVLSNNPIYKINVLNISQELFNEIRSISNTLNLHKKNDLSYSSLPYKFKIALNSPKYMTYIPYTRNYTIHKNKRLIEEFFNEIFRATYPECNNITTNIII